MAFYKLFGGISGSDETTSTSTVTSSISGADMVRMNLDTTGIGAIWSFCLFSLSIYNELISRNYFEKIKIVFKKLKLFWKVKPEGWNILYMFICIQKKWS